MLLMCPHVDLVGFLFFHCLFFPLKKSTYHFMPAQKLMRCLGSQAFLSNSAFLKSVGHMTVIKMYFKKILMAKGQQLHSKPANTSRQISKTKTKTHKPQTGNLQKENCSICLLQFEVDIKGMNGPVMVYLKIPPSSDALSFCGQCCLYKHILFRILQLVVKLTWPGSDCSVLLSVKVCSVYTLTWHPAYRLTCCQYVLPLDTVH